MSVDELVRRGLDGWPDDLDLDAAGVRVRRRVRARRRRRRAVTGGVAAIAAVALVVGVVASGTERPGDLTVVTAPEPTTSTASTTTTAPDLLAAMGPCRSLAPTAFDPLGPEPEPDPGSEQEEQEEVVPQPDTPCALALEETILDRLGPGWRRWEEGPFEGSPVTERSGPTWFGGASVQLTTDGIDVLSVHTALIPEERQERVVWGGADLTGLPDGYAGRTTVIDPGGRASGAITIRRPGRAWLQLSVHQQEWPGRGDERLPLTFDDLVALALDLAADGPVQPVGP